MVEEQVVDENLFELKCKTCGAEKRVIAKGEAEAKKKFKHEGCDGTVTAKKTWVVNPLKGTTFSELVEH